MQFDKLNKYTFGLGQKISVMDILSVDIKNKERVIVFTEDKELVQQFIEKSDMVINISELNEFSLKYAIEKTYQNIFVTSDIKSDNIKHSIDKFFNVVRARVNKNQKISIFYIGYESYD